MTLDYTIELNEEIVMGMTECLVWLVNDCAVGGAVNFTGTDF